MQLMFLIKKYNKSKILLLLFAILIVNFSSCESEISILNSAYWKDSSIVNYSEGYVDIVISGAPGVNWSASIAEGSDWCTFGSTDVLLSKITGFITNNDNFFRIYYNINQTSVIRNAKIVFQFEGEDAQSFVLTQMTTFSVFTETPSEINDSNYLYVTHYAKLNNKTVRNYSICYDKSKKAALWVAYPIHPSYLGSTSRTDEWAFDPIIHSPYQANCVSKSYGGNYDRGHQIASADRLATREMNLQTFYMTNITPQLNRLNQDMWANLEIKVRSNICNDTLFVVTGAYFDDNSVQTTSDGSGIEVPLPTHYFKVLLRTNTGSTAKAIVNCSDDELRSIGFWVEHRSYGDIDPPRTICMSVAEIEAKTGFIFFPQLSESVKKQNNPALWGL